MNGRYLEDAGLPGGFRNFTRKKRGERMRSRGLLFAVMALFAATAACGIVILPNRTVLDEPFKAEQVKAIQNGLTTKKEILAWFGPPLVVARPGTTVRMPEQELYNALGEDVSADTLFTRFKNASRSPRSPLLYYYEDQELEWEDLGAFLLLMPVVRGPNGSVAGPVNGRMKVTKLWILLDDANQRVVDHQIEEGKQKLTNEQLGATERGWR
jgi:hypothetical protein